jgi:hypothetical protein
MRACCIIFAFFFCHATGVANNPYHKYLQARIYGLYEPPLAHLYKYSAVQAGIPRYHIPKGNIFCRMEDKLTKATGVWIKIGVESK